jgi:hypothetical protein
MASFLSHVLKLRPMSRDRLNTLFKQYEAAFDKLDLRTISGYCGDTFQSVGPNGTISATKKDYVDSMEKVAELYRRIGRKSARIISQRMIPICDKYSIVVIRWGVIFEKMGSVPVEFDISYIVYEGDEPRIILLISHEDEESILKKLGFRTAY